jgi:hypothetical protein
MSYKSTEPTIVDPLIFTMTPLPKKTQDSTNPSPTASHRAHAHAHPNPNHKFITSRITQPLFTTGPLLTLLATIPNLTTSRLAPSCPLPIPVTFILLQNPYPKFPTPVAASYTEASSHSPSNKHNYYCAGPDFIVPAVRPPRKPPPPIPIPDSATAQVPWKIIQRKLR